MTWIWCPRRLLVSRWLPAHYLLSVYSGYWASWAKPETIRSRGRSGWNPHPSITTSPAETQSYYLLLPGKGESGACRAKNSKGECTAYHLLFPQESWQVHFHSKCEGGKEMERKKSSSPRQWILRFYSLKALLCFQCTQNTSVSAPFLIFAWRGQKFPGGPHRLKHPTYRACPDLCGSP